MFVAGNVVYGLAVVADNVLWLYMWVVIIRALVSWVRPDPWSPVMQFLNLVTEPALAPIRRGLSRMGWMGGIDFSPILLILVIVFLQSALVTTLYQLASNLR